MSNNAETLKPFEFLSKHFQNTQIRALYRGYDDGFVFDYFIPREESFILRMNDRSILHKGKKISLVELAKEIKGKYALNFHTKNSQKINCKISIVPVSLPNHPEIPLNLVICKSLGKETILLLTNLKERRLDVTITKVYLMRWREAACD